MATEVAKSMATTVANDDMEESSNGTAQENETMIPQTPQGLAAFLEKIDGPCPLKGNHEDNSSTIAATYQATAVRIPASDKKQVRIPIFAKNSTVTWQVGVDECDVMFSIFQETATSEASQEEEDETVVVVVEPQIVTAVTKEEQEALDTSTSSNASTSSTTMVLPALSGEFVVETEIPATIILQFGNEYSWFTPKTISYSVTVNPPLNPAKMQRAKRAAEALQLVVAQTYLAQAQVAKHKNRVQEQTLKLQETSQKHTEKKASVDHQETVVQASHDQMREMGLLHQKVMQQLASKRAQLTERDEQITDLERQIDALQRQLLARVQEKEALQKDVAAGAVSAQKLVQRIELLMQETKQKDEVYLIQVQDECQAIHAKVAAANKARDEALQEEQMAAQKLDFLKRVADALRLRL